jgi:hypothetical protein
MSLKIFFQNNDRISHKTKKIAAMIAMFNKNKDVPVQFILILA